MRTIQRQQSFDLADTRSRRRADAELRNLGHERSLQTTASGGSKHRRERAGIVDSSGSRKSQAKRSDVREKGRTRRDGLDLACPASSTSRLIHSLAARPLDSCQHELPPAMGRVNCWLPCLWGLHLHRGRLPVLAPGLLAGLSFVPSTMTFHCEERQTSDF